MGESHLGDQVDLVAATPPDGGGRPLADAVHHEDGRGLERRWMERARRMRVVVVAELQFLFRAAPSFQPVEIPDQVALLRSFSLIQMGIAPRKDSLPFGAKAR